MADNSAIEWTDATWNPVRARNLETGKVGWHCEHATTGCEFCYAEGFNKRLGTGLAFKPGHRADIEIFLDEAMLTQPLRWKKPRRIFVGSMTDLFADFVPDEFIDRMFAVMALAPQHTFQLLTKRAARMREYLTLPRTMLGEETLGAYECIYIGGHLETAAKVAEPAAKPSKAPAPRQRERPAAGAGLHIGREEICLNGQRVRVGPRAALLVAALAKAKPNFVGDEFLINKIWTQRPAHAVDILDQLVRDLAALKPLGLEVRTQRGIGRQLVEVNR